MEKKETSCYRDKMIDLYTSRKYLEAMLNWKIDYRWWKKKFSIKTQKTISIYIDEIYSKPPKRNYAINKTDVHHIDDLWSLDVLDLKNHGAKKNKDCGQVLFVIGNFSEFGWTVPLKSKLL